MRKKCSNPPTQPANPPPPPNSTPTPKSPAYPKTSSPWPTKQYPSQSRVKVTGWNSKKTSTWQWICLMRLNLILRLWKRHKSKVLHQIRNRSEFEYRSLAGRCQPVWNQRNKSNECTRNYSLANAKQWILLSSVTESGNQERASLLCSRSQ